MFLFSVNENFSFSVLMLQHLNLQRINVLRIISHFVEPLRFTWLGPELRCLPVRDTLVVRLTLGAPPRSSSPPAGSQGPGPRGTTGERVASDCVVRLANGVAHGFWPDR